MTDHKPSTEADELKGWQDCLRQVRGSLEGYPNHGGDIEIMKAVEHIADLARAAALREARTVALARASAFHSHLGDYAIRRSEAEIIAAKILSLLTQSAADALTKHDAELFRKPNGCFSDRVFTEILVPASCGVPGHFKFQENGGHCMMCQKHRAELESVYAKVRELVERWRKESTYASSGSVPALVLVQCAAELSAILPPEEERRSDG